MTALPSQVLDDILSVQLLIAWAGENPGGEHPRLGWWKTDVIDAEGGGDLWKRLLPRTSAWAGFDAARRAARLTERGLLSEHAHGDQMRTLFHLGYAVDEALDERLALHKLEARPPPDVLPLLSAATGRLSADALKERLNQPGLDAAFKIVPGARQLKRVPTEAPAALARRVACAALTDPPPAYPLPFVMGDPSDG